MNDLIHATLFIEKSVSLHAGRCGDRTSPFQSERLPAGALRLSDLGYFDLKRLASITEQGGYWLTRPQTGTTWYSADGQPLAIVKHLRRQNQATIDRPVQLGVQDRLLCRLLAWRVPAAVARQRRARLQTKARRKQQAVSPERLQLAGWTLYVTNLSPAQLSLAEAQVLARVRWQIELLFKLWKSHGQIDASTSQKPWRIVCEVYAKLLAQLVQHWILLVTHWPAPDHRLVKTAQIICQHAAALISAFSDGDAMHLADVLRRLQVILARRARINKRRAHPHAFQLLLALTSQVA